MIFKKAIVCAHIDGDTTVVKLDNGLKERVRFIGINCPESTIKQEPYGKEAAGYTKNNLLGKVIYLEKDISDRDIYEDYFAMFGSKFLVALVVMR